MILIGGEFDGSQMGDIDANTPFVYVPSYNTSTSHVPQSDAFIPNRTATYRREYLRLGDSMVTVMVDQHLSTLEALSLLLSKYWKH